MILPYANGAGPRALGDDDVPTPPSATGQYPDPVWAPPAAAAALADPGDDDAPVPPSATGQYPDPVWAPPPSAAAALSAGDEDVPAPPSATGQYPGPVWSDGPAAAALAGEAPPAAAPPATVADEAPRPEDRRKEEGYDDALAVPADADALPPGLDLPEMYRIVRVAAEADSGADLYAAVLADDPAHAAAHGLAWGLALFTQASGRLGSVLRLTQQRDAALFDRLFGPDSLALLQVTTAGTREARLAPISGQALTHPAWVERFRAAGAEEACRNAQNEEAIARMLRPVLRLALALGLDTDRGLAMAFDRVSARGLGGGARWLVEASGLGTPEQVQAALSAVGAPDVRAFQEASGWLPVTGQAGAETTAALLEEVRRQGALPLPTAAEVQDRLVAAAQGSARRRLARLRVSPQLSDRAYR